MKSKGPALFLLTALFSPLGTLAVEPNHTTPSNGRPAQGTKCPPELEGEANDPMILSFFGKSVHLAFDIGVMKAAIQKVPAVKRNDTVLAGNSSGSLLAAYYSCWGVSEQSTREVEAIVRNFDYSLINAGTRSKMFALLMGRKIREYPHSNINPLIDSLLNRNGKRCEPKGPLMIGAANGDVLKSHDDKIYNEVDNSISFRGRNLGKACTYFVTAPVLEKLLQVPERQRRCELRKIENYEDLKFALFASASEPTFFPKMEETNISKIVDSSVPNHAGRNYIGGYLTWGMAEDYKRSSPGSYAMGSLTKHFSGKIDNLLKSWYTISPTEAMKRGERSMDFQLKPDQIEWDEAIPDTEALFNSGCNIAKEQFRRASQECASFK